LSERVKWTLPAVVIAPLLVASLISGIPHYIQLGLSISPDSWVPVKVHRTGSMIARLAIGKPQVLSLSPIFPLEGGLSIYPQWAASVFTARSSGLFTQEDRRA